MNTMEAIAQRQSCRAYADTQLTEAEITTILQAANAAPVGMGKYESVKLTVIQNKELLDKINKTAAQAFNKPDACPTYNAPSVILVSAASQDGTGNSVAYCNAACIVENMSLAATELGLGHVYLLGMIPAISASKELCAELKVPEGFVPVSAIAIGKPAGELQSRSLTTSKIATDFVR